MELNFDIIAHRHQRYKTVGDWFERAGTWYFRVSRMKDKRYMWLVFLHEVIEWGVCQVQGVKTRAIDEFDIGYEDGRRAGEKKAPCGCKFQEEPGDDRHAPYHEAHVIATQCERIVARGLGVNWAEYDEVVSEL